MGRNDEEERQEEKEKEDIFSNAPGFDYEYEFYRKTMMDAGEIDPAYRRGWGKNAYDCRYPPEEKKDPNLQNSISATDEILAHFFVGIIWFVIACGVIAALIKIFPLSELDENLFSYDFVATTATLVVFGAFAGGVIYSIKHTGKKKK